MGTLSFSSLNIHLLLLPNLLFLLTSPLQPPTNFETAAPLSADPHGAEGPCVSEDSFPWKFGVLLFGCLVFHLKETFSSI